MSDQTALPFVGSLLLQSGDQRTAFVCHAPTLLVTANHKLPDEPETIRWTNFASGQWRDIEKWVYLVRDHETDVAILGVEEELLESALVPALPPFELRQAVIDTRYYALVEYNEGGVIEYEWDPGTARIVGSRLKHPNRMKVEASQVTPGCSGAPLVIDTVCGPIVVGMVSARYNSQEQWNEHVVWAVHPKALRRALNRAVSQRVSNGPARVSRDFLASLGVDISELPEELAL